MVGKFFGIIIICLLFAQPVAAVRLAPGSVPQNEPLQPFPDPSVVPNVQNNVTGSSEIPVQNQGDENNNSISQPSEVDGGNATALSTSTANTTEKKHGWGWFLGLALLVIGVVIGIWRYAKK